MKEILTSTLTFLASHLVEVVGILIAYLSLVVPIRQYLGQKQLEEKDKRFNNFHKLIKELVYPEGQAMLDRQIAVVFELRNYPEYFEVTKRILAGLRQDWSPAGNQRIINEINLTISFIDRA